MNPFMKKNPILKLGPLSQIPNRRVLGRRQQVTRIRIVVTLACVAGGSGCARETFCGPRGNFSRDLRGVLHSRSGPKFARVRRILWLKFIIPQNVTNSKISYHGWKQKWLAKDHSQSIGARRDLEAFLVSTKTTLFFFIRTFFIRTLRLRFTKILRTC